MARQRMIKPKFWDDVKIGKLKRDARLIYIGMWNFSDDMGVIISDSVYLKSKIFPYDKDIQLTQFETWLADLERLGFISRLHHNGEGFYYLPKFSRHQTINRPNEDDFNIPNAELERILKDSVMNHGLITDESVPIREEKRSKEEDKKKGKEKEKPPEIIFPFLSDEFKELWQNWKVYRKNEFKKVYKTAQSEQAALQNICKLSSGNEAIAKEIIMQSIANQWQGLFELKTNNNGKPSSNGTQKPGSKINGEQLNEAFTKFYQQ